MLHRHASHPPHPPQGSIPIQVPYQPPPSILPASHLPSASSFYASLLQPLGIQYFPRTHPPHSPTPTVLDFGFLTSHLQPHIVFKLTQSPPPHLQPPGYRPRLAHLILPASSPKAVHDFCHQAELLLPGSGSRIERIEGGGEHCALGDFDGNVVEVIWTPPLLKPYQHSPLPPPQQHIQIPRHTVSPRERERENRIEDDIMRIPPISLGAAFPPDKESRKVLEWQKQVARSMSEEDSSSSDDDDEDDEDEDDNNNDNHRISVPPIRLNGHAPSDISYQDRRERDEALPPGPGTFRRSETYSFPPSKDKQKEQDRPRVSRRETVTNIECHCRHAPEHPDRGIEAKQVVGTIFGAAASAALIYTMMGSRPESPPLSAVDEDDETVNEGLCYGEREGSSRGIAKPAGIEYTHLNSESKGITMVDRSSNRRDSGVEVDAVASRSYISERSSAGSRERLRDFRPRFNAYEVSGQVSGSRGDERNHASGSKRSSREENRKGSEPGSRNERPMTILTAKSAGSHVSRNSGSGSGSGSGFERRHERARERLREGERAMESEGNQAPEKSTARTSSRSRASQSFASAHTHQTTHSLSPIRSPPLSVISQSPSTASGSTVRAERELLTKVPTPPSAISSRSHRGRSRRGSHASRTSALDEERFPTTYRGMGRLYPEYAAANGCPSTLSQSRNPQHPSPPYVSPQHSPREKDYGRERVGDGRRSHVSAKDISLPRSVAGFEYADSVAPSDSISSVGMKRERDWLRERMNSGVMGIRAEGW